MSPSRQLAILTADDRLRPSIARLDDVTLIQHPEVVVAGLRVFQHEARARGWEVNMDKTVVGCGYYMPAGERADYVQRVRTVFAGVLLWSAQIDENGV